MDRSRTSARLTRVLGSAFQVVDITLFAHLNLGEPAPRQLPWIVGGMVVAKTGALLAALLTGHRDD